MSKIAETILQQLWGKKFIAMTGAKNLSAWSDKLQFSIPVSNNINSVVIQYNEQKDDYLMEFYNIRWGNFKEISSFNGLYFDNLIDVFEKETGLFCSL